MEARITHVVQETDSVKSFVLDMPMDFSPGQRISCNTPAGPRTFSISTSPTEGAVAFTTVVNDSLSKKFLDSLKPGDPVSIIGPSGSFTLDENAPRPITMIAGGIGIAPFRSMIKYSIDKDLPHSMTLIHSMRTQFDVIFEDDIEAWEDHDRFWYIPTLTRAEPTDWYGELGRISEEMIRNHADMESLFYIAGTDEFVESISGMLRNMGVDDAMVRTEAFSGY